MAGEITGGALRLVSSNLTLSANLLLMIERLFYLVVGNLVKPDEVRKLQDNLKIKNLVIDKYEYKLKLYLSGTGSKR